MISKRKLQKNIGVARGYNLIFSWQSEIMETTQVVFNCSHSPARHVLDNTQPKARGARPLFRRVVYEPRQWCTISLIILGPRLNRSRVHTKTYDYTYTWIIRHTLQEKPRQVTKTRAVAYIFSMSVAAESPPCSSATCSLTRLVPECIVYTAVLIRYIFHSLVVNAKYAVTGVLS